ncbi:MAG: ABC transporter ATP-binding protein, partial [Lachnospiraceae bacterium]|nr:ABC transporter ATP-binding protein [Lachnospiraceae bacterium]
MNVIELQEISFTYPDEETPVFTGLSLEVPEGQSLILKGDNGSGKTTLFRILNGLSFPDAGTYRFRGEEITEEYLKDNGCAKRFHQKIGYLFQNPDIMLFNGRVYDEIAFGPRQMGLP